MALARFQYRYLLSIGANRRAPWAIPTGGLGQGTQGEAEASADDLRRRSRQLQFNSRGAGLISGQPRHLLATILSLHAADLSPRPGAT